MAVLTVMVSVLEVANKDGELEKDRAMHELKLKPDDFGKFLAVLTNLGLVEHKAGKYVVTSKGYEFIHRYKQLVL